MDFDAGPGVTNLTSAGCDDIFVAMYDASGIYVYAKAMGGTGSDVGYSIVVDGSENTYVTGTFVGLSDFARAPVQLICLLVVRARMRLFLGLIIQVIISLQAH